jgi:heme/copper-type cytochrome/quinol oxidase subunit 2
MRQLLSTGTIVLLIALGVMLLGAGAFMYQGMVSGGDETLPGHFYIAMTLGVVFSIIVGVGLMALIFFSNRKGYDEPPTFGE